VGGAGEVGRIVQLPGHPGGIEQVPEGQLTLNPRRSNSRTRFSMILRLALSIGSLGSGSMWAMAMRAFFLLPSREKT
jgi:hypothetical protein